MSIAVGVLNYVYTGIGLLGDPKKFNVALTRAQALVIVIGDPWILFHDPHWKRLLQYCVANNSYRGCACAALGVHDDALAGEEEDPHTLAEQLLLTQRELGDGGASHSTGTFDMYYGEESRSRVAL